MATRQKIFLNESRVRSRSDMLKALFHYEIEMRTSTSEERRKALKKLLQKLWPEYLAA